MSAQPSEAGMRRYAYPEEERRGRYGVAERERGSGVPAGALLLVGLGAIGLGFLAWHYLGPDLVRYMKIRNM
jgi:hypothetical protein